MISVAETAEFLRRHPLLPNDVTKSGFVTDPVTGEPVTLAQMNPEPI